MTRPGSNRAIVRPATGRGFRGDVQGLRAVAVLTVIAGHAGVPFLPGGFVGVDVFFVISGFLISQLLFREVDRDAKISLRDFYARRARRILPAATVVTLVTLLASILLISAIDALEVVKDALWATFFAANIRFASVGTDYFAQDQIASPLQHYWSLAVEEQFYLVWPLILLACVWLARRSRSRGTGARVAERQTLPRLTVFWVLVAIGTASFAFGIVYTSNERTAAYFSTPARAWELAIGAIAALVAHAVARQLSSAVRATLCAGGLVAIVLACVLYGDGTPFPGTAALLPVLGSAAVLVAGAGLHEREPWPMRLLSVRPMRVVGDWSYSLYLWHWPLLLIPYLRTGNPLSGWGAALAVAGAFVLAGLTYRYVETPLRSATYLPRPRALLLYPVSVAVLVLACVGANSYVQSQVGGTGSAITVDPQALASQGVKVSKNDTIALVQASVEAALAGDPLPQELHPALTDLRNDVPSVGDCDYTDAAVRTLCPGGDTGSDKVIAVLGNSHGRMWIPAFERIAQQAGYRTYYFVKPNCTAADLLVSDLDNFNEPWQACSDFRDWAFGEIEQLHPDLAVVSTSGPNPVIYTDDGQELRQGDPGRLEATQAGFESTLTRLAATADRVVLLRDVPKSQDDPATCLTTGSIDLGTCMFTPFEPQEEDSDASEAAALATGTDYIDPTPWICWHDYCPVVIGDILTYRDRGHLSAVYAGELGDDLGRKLGIWTD